MTSKLALLAKSAITAAILLLLPAPAIGQTATVTTDKNHYSPGETVIITGAGWQPGETVNMVIREDPSTHLDHFLSSVADSSGNFTNTEFSPEEHDAGVMFTLTATGQSSGRTAQTTFIDAPAPHFDIASNHVATLGSHVFTALVRNVVGSSPDTARCIRVTTPASVTVTGATHVVANPGATGPWTLTTGANFVELRTDTNSNTGIFGSTLGSDNWVRFEITATASSIATEEWSASMSSDNAKSGCSDSTDRLGVSVAESLPRQYTADFRDGSDNVIAAPTAAEDSTQAYRIRITRTAGTDDLSRAIVALPTCFTNVTAISMTSSGSPSFTPELSDNVFLLTTFVGTKIAANADWVQLHFTATADCSPGPHAFRTASWKNQNAETPQGDIFQLAGTGLPPLTVTSLAVCGNSVVEGSEQCDQGAANGTAGSCCSATCTFESQATVCRAGSGDLCDPAETCTGSSAACPADTFEPSTTVCNAGSGDACDPDEMCPGTAGGACPADNVATADTVCNPGSGDACDPDELCTGVADTACPDDNVAAAGTVCNPGSGDLCDADEVCTGVAGAACPADTFEPSTTVCNPGSGDACDPDELCPGTAGGACPADNVATADTVCNPGSGDACDPDELCTGVADAACPADNVASAGTVCNPGSGDLCDADEVCTGVAGATCPEDTFEPSTTVCNPGSGDACDPDEMCPGTAGAACPTDNVATADTVCNPGSGDACDPDELCTGVADAACPADNVATAGTVCNPGSGDLCDADEVCTGVAGAACPEDTFEPATTVCNPGSGDACDPDEMCPGTAGAACPTDNVATADTVCNPGSGDACDPDELCTGVADAACPADNVASAGTVCNPGSGDFCDPDEVCTGVAGAACPADTFQPATAVCNPGSGDACDPDEFCTGSPNQACPADNVAAAGTTCRAAAGVCDATEQCTGTANQACPADVKKGAETTCRGSAGVCDTAETCNGTSNACPNDAFQPATVVCRPEADGCDLGETCTGSSALCPADVLQARVFLVIDEESIDNGNPPNFFSAADVNDNIARIGLRSELPYFASHENQTITLHTGTVGDEGWFAPKTIPTKWGTVGPTGDGLRNYILAGPGLGSGGNPDRWLDKIPDVTPLRATGLNMLEGACVCALVYDSNISINYGPLNGNLKGANLGLAAFEVENVTQLTGYSSGSLPKVEIEIRDAAEVCNGPLTLLSAAPAPTSSSQPYDTVP